MTKLPDTTGKQVVEALAAERRTAGAVAFGLVLTLVTVVEERSATDAIEVAASAAMAHPCRTIVVIRRQPDAPRPRLDAEVSIGGAHGTGETVLLRMSGRLALHADSVVLPLLAPDAPVVTWWYGEPPAQIGTDPLGVLADRRVTDCAAADDPRAALEGRARDYRPGDTDLAWSRLTPWRAVLASALDPMAEPTTTAASVLAEEHNPSAPLLAGWLSSRLGIAAQVAPSPGPGVTEVRLELAHADDDGGPARGRSLRLTRLDGRSATLSRQGQPDRSLPLARRQRGDLLAEELRRLDPDAVYAEALGATFGLTGLSERPATRTHVWRDIDGDQDVRAVLPGVTLGEAEVEDGLHRDEQAAQQAAAERGGR